MCAQVIPGVAGEFYGSISDLTFSKVKCGFNVVKKKPNPFKTKTEKRRAIRDNVAQADNNWLSLLTNDNKSDWIDAAANFSQSRHGISYSISGHNLYVAYFCYMKIIGETPLDAPTIFSGRLTNIGCTFTWWAATHQVKCTMDRVPTSNEYILLYYTNADKPNATYRRIRYQTFIASGEGGGDNFLIPAEYRAQDGTLHLRWVLIDARGSYSSPNIEHYSYTYS